MGVLVGEAGELDGEEGAGLEGMDWTEGVAVLGGRATKVAGELIQELVGEPEGEGQELVGGPEGEDSGHDAEEEDQGLARGPEGEGQELAGKPEGEGQELVGKPEGSGQELVGKPEGEGQELAGELEGEDSGHDATLELTGRPDETPSSSSPPQSPPSSLGSLEVGVGEGMGDVGDVTWVGRRLWVGWSGG